MAHATQSHQAIGSAGIRGFWLLRAGFTVSPILFGIDKFFNWMVDWPQYLAPWLDDIIPGTAQEFMYGAGVVEIVAGIVVAFAPWFGGYLVAAWLGGIIVNLISYDPPLFYDIALRDLGLMMGALTLAVLAQAYRSSRRADQESLR